MAKKRKAAKRKALARKVSRKQALSYDRMAPNKRGVTALSEINGRGAYQRRYRQTRRMLEKGDAMANAKGWKGQMYREQVRSGRTPAQARATVRMIEAQKKSSGAKSRRKSSGTRSASARRSSTGASARGRYRSNLRKGGKRLTKSEYIEKQRRKGRTPKQAAADWKLASGYYKKKKDRKSKPRTYGKGKYKALKARVGGPRGQKTRQTFLYRTKKGNIRHIPDHAILGYKSARAMNEVYRSGTERERARLAERLQRLYERREREADRAAARARKGTAWFSPNAGDELSFEEFKKMKRKKKKSTRKRRMKSNASRRRDSKGRFLKKRGGSKRKSTKRKRRRTATPKRDSKGRFLKKRSTTRRRKATASRRRKASSKRKSRSKKKGFAAMSKAERCRIAAKGGRAAARKRYGKRRKKKPCARYVKNRSTARRKSGTRRSTAMAKRSRKSTTKRSYKRNVSGAAFKMELKNALKYGGIVVGGFLTHRVLTNMLDKYGLSKVEALSTGTAGEYRGLISGALVAAVGIPLTVRVLPKHAGVAAAGMAASLLQGLIMTALKKAEQPELLEAVSAYPNAEGYPQYSGYGAYYEYSPHQIYGAANGFGEFYETQPIPGLEQAAAGYGQPDIQGQMLTQAAAGVGQLQQMYANPMGEYFAYGAEGIGEYESAPYAGGAEPHIDDGIAPNTHSAEQMLNVAEAAAGLGNTPYLSQAAAGFGDLPLQQTVEPSIRAMDIPDMPGGSRAGVLAGGDGIFG